MYIGFVVYLVGEVVLFVYDEEGFSGTEEISGGTGEINKERRDIGNPSFITCSAGESNESAIISVDSGLEGL